jgi:hypothetical protein
MCGALPLFPLYVLMAGLEHIYRVHILYFSTQWQIHSYLNLSGMSDYVCRLSTESRISAGICYS